MSLIQCAGVEIELPEDKLPEWMHIVPLGTWRGHPSGIVFSINEDDCRAIVAAYEASGVDIPLDWEHGTQLAPTRGNRAPAAGWLHQLQFRAGRGVYARVKSFLPQGGEDVLSKAYRYASPVIVPQHRDPRTGETKGKRVMSVALTNIPFFGGALEPILARGDSMLLPLLLAALQMPETATEEEAVAEAKRLKDAEANGGAVAASAALGDALCTALQVDVAGADAALAGLLARPTAALVTELEAELAALKSSRSASEKDVLLNSALEEGLIMPAQRDQVAAMFDAAPIACRAFLAGLRPVAALGGPQARQPERTGRQLTELESTTARRMGLTDQEFLRGAAE